MSKAVFLSRSVIAQTQQRQLDVAGSVVVMALAAALIFAGQPLPL